MTDHNDRSSLSCEKDRFNSNSDSKESKTQTSKHITSLAGLLPPSEVAERQIKTDVQTCKEKSPEDGETVNVQSRQTRPFTITQVSQTDRGQNSAQDADEAMESVKSSDGNEGRATARSQLQDQ